MVKQRVFVQLLKIGVAGEIFGIGQELPLKFRVKNVVVHKWFYQVYDQARVAKKMAIVQEHPAENGPEQQAVLQAMIV